MMVTKLLLDLLLKQVRVLLMPPVLTGEQGYVILPVDLFIHFFSVDPLDLAVFVPSGKLFAMSFELKA
jgi:hypothetical protein